MVIPDTEDQMNIHGEDPKSLSEMVIPDTEDQFSDFLPSMLIPSSLFDGEMRVAEEDYVEARSGALENEKKSRPRESTIYRRRCVHPDPEVDLFPNLLCSKKWELMFLPHWDDDEADALFMERAMLKILLPCLFWVRSSLFFLFLRMCLISVGYMHEYIGRWIVGF